MWEVITSQGHRARDIAHESDAMRTVHALGITTLIAPGRYWFPIIGASVSLRRFIANRPRRALGPTYRPTAEDSDQAIARPDAAYAQRR